MRSARTSWRSRRNKPRRDLASERNAHQHPSRDPLGRDQQREERDRSHEFASPIRELGAVLHAGKAAGVDFIELPIGCDGLAVVVNVKNTWVDHLTVAERKRIWEPAATKTLSS